MPSKDSTVWARASKKYNDKAKAEGWVNRNRGNLKWDMKQYGITEMDYISLMIQQKNCCAGCGLHRSRHNYRLAVDHCHETGRVRQLLCGPCNRLLGKIESNPMRAINMLREVSHRP